jgi:hypothetical protein
MMLINPPGEKVPTEKWRDDARSAPPAASPRPVEGLAGVTHAADEVGPVASLPRKETP